jgi:hypothetical protein
MYLSKQMERVSWATFDFTRIVLKCQINVTSQEMSKAAFPVSRLRVFYRPALHPVYYSVRPALHLVYYSVRPALHVVYYSVRPALHLVYYSVRPALHLVYYSVRPGLHCIQRPISKGKARFWIESTNFEPNSVIMKVLLPISLHVVCCMCTYTVKRAYNGTARNRSFLPLQGVSV